MSEGAASKDRAAPLPFITHLVLFLGRPLCRLIFTILYRIRIDGRERVPRRGKLIVIANHQSLFDPITLGLLVANRPFRPIARRTLYRSRLMGATLRAFSAISLDQTKGDRAAIKAAIEVVNSGHVLILYPEGSRTPDGFVHEFQRGFMLVVRKTEAPILPAAIEGAFDIWPRSQSRPRLRGRIAARAGELIPYEKIGARDQEEFMDELRRKLETMRIELRAEIRARTRGRYPRDTRADKTYWEAGGGKTGAVEEIASSKPGCHGRRAQAG